MSDIKRHGANGRRALSVEHGGVLYTSGITSQLTDGGITEQTQDVLRVIDNLLARRGIDKGRVLSATVTLADHGRLRRVQRRVGRVGRGRLRARAQRDAGRAGDP